MGQLQLDGPQAELRPRSIAAGTSRRLFKGEKGPWS
jgi:hypothetical protein